MSFFVQTTVPLEQGDAFDNAMIETCDDICDRDGFIAVKVSARQFERIVTVLRAASVPHHTGTFAPAYFERDDGSLTEASERERDARAHTVLYGPGYPPMRTGLQ